MREAIASDSGQGEESRRRRKVVDPMNLRDRLHHRRGLGQVRPADFLGDAGGRGAQRLVDRAGIARDRLSSGRPMKRDAARSANPRGDVFAMKGKPAISGCAAGIA